MLNNILYQLPKLLGTSEKKGVQKVRTLFEKGLQWASPGRGILELASAFTRILNGKTRTARYATKNSCGKMAAIQLEHLIGAFIKKRHSTRTPINWSPRATPSEMCNQPLIQTNCVSYLEKLQGLNHPFKFVG